MSRFDLSKGPRGEWAEDAPLDNLLSKPVTAARPEVEPKEDRPSFRKRLWAMMARATLNELADLGLNIEPPQWMIEQDIREFIALAGGSRETYPGYQKWMNAQDFEHKMTVPGPNGTRARPTHKQWIDESDIEDGY